MRHWDGSGHLLRTCTFKRSAGSRQTDDRGLLYAENHSKGFSFQGEATRNLSAAAEVPGHLPVLQTDTIAMCQALCWVLEGLEAPFWTAVWHSELKALKRFTHEHSSSVNCP